MAVPVVVPDDEIERLGPYPNAAALIAVLVWQIGDGVQVGGFVRLT
jgi:hypothetical protein